MDSGVHKTALYVLPATAVGGAETRFHTIIKNMVGVRSVLLTHAVVSDFFSDLEIEIRLFDDYGCICPMPMSITNAISYSKAIADVVVSEKVDVIFGVMHVGTFYASVATDLRGVESRVIGSILGNVSAYFAGLNRSPTMYEKLIIRYMLARPRCVIVSSGGVRGDLINNFGGSPEKILVIPNGVNVDRVINLSREECPELEDGYSGKTLVTACRLNAQKDFGTLLKAFRLVDEEQKCRLIIVGGGELKNDIEGQVESMGLTDKVTLVGFQNNPFKFISRADVFILSSFFEGFGNVLVEAMACGVPVISSDCPSGPADIIQHLVNGILVKPQDERDMASAISEVLSNAELHANLASAGLLRAQDFKHESMLVEYMKIMFE